MKNSKIKTLFHTAEGAIHIDGEKKQETLELLEREIDKKKIADVDGNVQIWKNQFQYMDKRMFLVQAAECVFMLLYVIFMKHFGMGREEMIVSSVILSGILGILWVLQVGRLFYPNMAELAESCYFNTKQLAVFSMVYSGIISLAILMVMVLFVGYEWKIRFLQVGLYVLVPCVYTGCFCLGTLLTETGRRNPYIVAVTGSFAVALQIVIASIPRIYQPSAMLFWGAAFVVGIALLGIQVKVMFRELEKGEILCMN